MWSARHPAVCFVTLLAQCSRPEVVSATTTYNECMHVSAFSTAPMPFASPLHTNFLPVMSTNMCAGAGVLARPRAHQHTSCVSAARLPANVLVLS